jgi:hypothetical protein
VLWAPKAWVGLRCLVVADVNCGSLMDTGNRVVLLKSLNSRWLGS